MLYIEDENGNHILDENGNKFEYTVEYLKYKETCCEILVTSLYKSTCSRGYVLPRSNE